MASVSDTKATKSNKGLKKKEAAMTCEACVGHYLSFFRLCKKPAQQFEVDGVLVNLCEDHEHLAEQ